MLRTKHRLMEEIKKISERHETEGITNIDLSNPSYSFTDQGKAFCYRVYWIENGTEAYGKLHCKNIVGGFARRHATTELHNKKETAGKGTFIRSVKLIKAKCSEKQK